MTLLQAFILGIVQGIGEFLPISSSGHLVIVPYLFGWDYQGLGFDVALHMGTVLAVVIFFFRDWVSIFSRALSTEKELDSSNEKYPSNILWIILVSSIPAGVAGYYLEDLAEKTLRNPLLIASSLVIFAILLWIVDKLKNKVSTIKKINYKKGFTIGIAQAISLVPGVSRSGITATAGMLLGLNRESAMRFSFLLATPAIIGAFILTLNNISATQINLAFFVAIITSAITGFLSIKYLLLYLTKHGFAPFVIYRIILAIIILIFYLAK